MLKATLSHFIAVRDRTVANLNNYIANPAAVGEHPDLVGEVISLIEELDRANSCIALLTNLNQPEPAQPSEE